MKNAQVNDLVITLKSIIKKKTMRELRLVALASSGRRIMKNNIKKLIISVFVTCILATTAIRADEQLTGTLAGGAIGAGLGGAFGGKKGAGIGAAVGAATGLMAGSAAKGGREEREYRRSRARYCYEEDILNEMRAENRMLKQENRKLHKEIDRLDDQINKYLEKNDELETRNEKLEEKLRCCKQENKSLNKENRKLQKRVDELEDQTRTVKTRPTVIQRQVKVTPEKESQLREDDEDE